ncbi:MAG TPA: MFS transporter [Ferrovibrio sp.]|uniref:MFS transporter n=1 Tax=Ferrovibrio sp. TaxID=1917215 RepID=UPI002ED6A0DF
MPASPDSAAASQSSDSRSAAEPARTDWIAVAAVIAAGVIVSMQLGKLPPLIDALRAEFGLGLVLAGIVASSFNLVGAVIGVAAGFASDRIGGRHALGLGLLVAALGGLLGAAADSTLVLLTARLIEGLGFVLVVVAAPGLVTAAAQPRQRNLALGFWSAYMPLGVAFGMFGALLVGHLFDWRGLWLLLAGLLAVGAFAAHRLARGVDLPPARRFDAAVLKHPGPWLLAGCFACYTTQWFAIVTWIPTYLRDSGVTSETLIATGTALVVLINVIGNLSCAALMHRGLPRWLIMAVTSLAMSIFGVMSFAGSVPVLGKIGLAMVTTGIGGMLPAAVLASVPEHVRERSQIATVNGVVVQLLNIGSFVGPPGLAALVARFGGWSEGRWLLLGAGAIGCGLALALRFLASPKSPQP